LIESFFLLLKEKKKKEKGKKRKKEKKGRKKRVKLWDVRYKRKKRDMMKEIEK